MRIPAVSSAIEAFGAGLIDFAGLYPPASLPLPEAVASYRAHKESPESWMLGPFVIHAARLDELDDVLHSDERLDLSVLAATTATDSLQDLIAEDLHLIATYLGKRQPGKSGGRLRAIETRIPDGDSPSGRVHSLHQTVTAALRELSVSVDRVFVEVPPSLSQDELERIAVATANADSVDDQIGWSLKIRCGGMLETQVPDIETIGRFIASCSAAGCSFKATAGLHHPVRGQHRTGTIPMHGFLNVFGCAILHHSGSLPADQIEHLLAETRPEALLLDSSGFSWRTFTASANDIIQARKSFARSIGSCSFVEPINDLKELHIL